MKRNFNGVSRRPTSLSKCSTVSYPYIYPIRHFNLF
jgi:hypothetical protein